MGCSVRCTYCPQDAFTKAYTQENLASELLLSLENFKKALEHISLWLDVCFTGFAEPFENPYAFQMLEYVCIGKPSGLIPGDIVERIKKEKIVTFRAFHDDPSGHEAIAGRGL